MGIDLELGFGWTIRISVVGVEAESFDIAGRCYSRVMVASDPLATMTLE